jgi:Predicted eukaryotic-type DNA primase
MNPAKTQLDIDGIKVEVSNLDKVFYPKSGFTKGEVIDYYVRISPSLLPH